jgi:hypothetical protein
MSTGISQQALRQVLDETAGFLEKYGESVWSTRLRRATMKSTIDVREICTWFGGMGSFNDLIIAQINGHHIEPGAEQTANAKLAVLRHKIYELATENTG